VSLQARQPKWTNPQFQTVRVELRSGQSIEIVDPESLRRVHAQFVDEHWEISRVMQGLVDILDSDGVADHGLLGGLGDQADHTWAVTIDGTREMTANWDAGSYKITSQQLESDVATGTAPLVVASTTVVTNLNADKLDGYDAADIDYAFVSGNDGATDVTGAELEELTDGSTTTLHDHDVTGLSNWPTIDYTYVSGNDVATDVSGAELEELTDGSVTTLHDHDVTGLTNWPTIDYSYVSGNDGNTDVSGSELETLTDTSNADSLHVHDHSAITDGTPATSHWGCLLVTCTGSNLTDASWTSILTGDLYVHASDTMPYTIGANGEFAITVSTCTGATFSVRVQDTTDAATVATITGINATGRWSTTSIANWPDTYSNTLDIQAIRTAGSATNELTLSQLSLMTKAG